MQNTLYEFLVVNKKLSLPGVGTISFRQNSSQLDFTNRQLSPPSFYFVIESKDDKPSKKLFEWLSSSHGIPEWDAVKSLNDLSFFIRDKLSEAGEMNWEGVGVFRRDAAGNLQLDPPALTFQSLQAVHAEKVIREKFEHTVLVGEREKSSIEMEEYFAEEVPKKNYAWIIAIVLTVLAVMIIGGYFSQKGLTPSSAGNTAIIKSK